MSNVIFYSWQSDLPNATNRGLIERALEQAAKLMRSYEELVIDPVIDRDTANVPGAPDIGTTILEKIDRATVFVADVSIVNRKSKFRPTPNPNVLIELGYALKGLGWQRIVLIANTAFGPPELLPFDLRQKRVITYHSAPSDQTQKDKRDQLSMVLGRAIRPILERQAPSNELAKIDPGANEVSQRRPRVIVERFKLIQQEDEATGEEYYVEAFQLLNVGDYPAVSIQIEIPEFLGRAVQLREKPPAILRSGDGADLEVRNLEKLLESIQKSRPYERGWSVKIPLIVKYRDLDHKRWSTPHAIAYTMLHGISVESVHPDEPPEWTDLAALAKAASGR